MEHPSPYVITVIGLLIVFLVLSLIAGAVALIGRLDENREQASAYTKSLLAPVSAYIRQLRGLPPLPEPSAQEPEVAAEPTPTIDHTTLVLISAAVATVGLGRTRIRSVRRLAPEQSAAWSSQGRAVLIGSHAVNPRHPS